jgi:hypothetical protein
MFEKQALKCYHPRLRQKYLLLVSKEYACLPSQQSYDADHSRTIIKIQMHKQTRRPSLKHGRISFLAWALASTCSKDRIRFDHLGKVSSSPSITFSHSESRSPEATENLRPKTKRACLQACTETMRIYITKSQLEEIRMTTLQKTKETADKEHIHHNTASANLRTKDTGRPLNCGWWTQTI